MEDEFDIEVFKHAIGMVESNGGKFLSSSTSSAAGKYHFLYELIKGDSSMRDISKREFMNNPELQEKVMDKALKGTLHNYGNTGYINDAIKNKSSFKSDLKVEEIAALQHFLGRTGVKRYLKDPSTYSIVGRNLSPEKYLSNFNQFSDNFTREFPKKEVQFGPQKIDDKEINIGKYKDWLGDDGIENQEQIKNINPLRLDNQESFKDPKVLRINDQNKNAYGGNVETEGNTPFVEFSNGGTHEQNPIGGIPIGRGEDGVMSTVEQNETKFDFGEDGEYIFSDRIDPYELYKKKK